MKKLMLIVAFLVVASPVLGATTPTPIPTPSVVPSPSTSPTPVPADIPDGIINYPFDISLRLDFTTAQTDQKLINIRTGATFTVPARQRFYVKDVNWSLMSAVVGILELDGASSDQLFDKMNAASEGQGKVIHFSPSITSLDAGISPCVTTDRAATGWVYIGGELK